MPDFKGFTAENGEEITAEKQAKMAETIGKLIAMSEDDSLTKEARASYAEKAEHLMREYRVNEEYVVTSGQAQVTAQRYRIVLVEQLGKWFAGEFADEYQRIWREIRKHAELVGHIEYEWANEEREARNLVAVGYGYEMDIRLAQFLWTSAHLTFATRVEARVDRNLSDQLNCYYMRSSGQERNDIAEALWGSARTNGVAHGKVQKLYLAECEARGEQPLVGGRGFIAKRYREAFAQGFCDQFGWRLRDARSAVDAKSGGLILHGRKERLQDAYWAEWPDKAPETAEERAAREERMAAYWARQAEEQLHCETKGNCAAALRRAEAKAAERGWGLSDRERETAKCKKHRPYESTVAERTRWSREQNAPERSAGRRAGAAAADSVQFRRTGGERTQKAGPAETRTALPGA